MSITYLFDSDSQIIVYGDGERIIAEPTNGGLWYVKPNDFEKATGEFTPPDPEPDDRFIYPFDFNHATSEYGERPDPFGSGDTVFHSGIDGSTSAGVGSGADVIAAGDGTVIAAGWNVRGGWGNSIIIDHGDGLWTGYAHMQSGSPFYSVGDTISQGDILGLVGTTGSSTGAHLHFTTWVNGQTVNPRNFMVDYA